MDKSLIYGKNDLDRIVSIEVKDNIATIFRELEDGSEDVIEYPHRYWILSNRQHSSKWNRLDGDQFYKYGIQFSTLKEYISAKKEYKKRNLDIYSISQSTEAFQIKDGLCFFKDMVHTNVSILCFDIEATGLEHDDTSKVLCISNTYRSNGGNIVKRLFSYDDYENCAEMIDAWADWVREMNPAILAAHNGVTYDLPYLNYCHSRYSDTGVCLGRDGTPISFNTHYEAKFRVDGSRDLHYYKCSIYGRQYIDTMFLAYNYDRTERKYQSYSLKPIIEQEGLVKEGRTFYPADQIRHKYKDPEEWAKIKAYCIDDADDVLAVYDLAIPPFFYMTQMIPKTFQAINESASGAQLNAMMVRSYLQNKHSIPKAEETERFEGAISFGEPGIYKNAVSLDIASLYPSIMLQYDVYDKKKDPNRHMLTFLEYMRNERLKNKKLSKETGNAYYKHLDLSYKILINSLYGFMGATGLHYNYPAGAAETTRRGREILTQSIEWAAGKGFKVPKGDTDSITLYKSGQVVTQEEADSLIKEINDLLPEMINFELDSFYENIIVFKAKNYAYLEKGKITMKGSALKGSTKCQKLKDYTKKSIEMALKGCTEAELQAYYFKHVEEIVAIQDMKPWAVRRTYSAKTDESETTVAAKLRGILEGTDYREGDRFYTFYLPEDQICLIENFAGVYDKFRLLENLFDTMMLFDTVIPDCKLKFLNYKLKRNEKFLPGYIAPPVKEKVVKPRKRKVKECAPEVIQN